MIISVEHTDNHRGAQVVAQIYDVDSGPLAMPKHIHIGGLTWDRKKIENYSMQVEEYEIWMEDQLKAGNAEVMQALDEIYNKAIGGGVIITTRCLPSPYVTHGHMVKKTILQLAGG